MKKYKIVDYVVFKNTIVGFLLSWAVAYVQET